MFARALCGEILIWVRGIMFSHINTTFPGIIFYRVNGVYLVCSHPNRKLFLIWTVHEKASPEWGKGCFFMWYSILSWHIQVISIVLMCFFEYRTSLKQSQSLACEKNRLKAIVYRTQILWYLILEESDKMYDRELHLIQYNRFHCTCRRRQRSWRRLSSVTLAILHVC